MASPGGSRSPKVKEPNISSEVRFKDSHLLVSCSRRNNSHSHEDEVEFMCDEKDDKEDGKDEENKKKVVTEEVNEEMTVDVAVEMVPCVKEIAEVKMVEKMIVDVEVDDNAGAAVTAAVMLADTSEVIIRRKQVEIAVRRKIEKRTTEKMEEVENWDKSKMAQKRKAVIAEAGKEEEFKGMEAVMKNVKERNIEAAAAKRRKGESIECSNENSHDLQEIEGRGVRSDIKSADRNAQNKHVNMEGNEVPCINKETKMTDVTRIEDKESLERKIHDANRYTANVLTDMLIDAVHRYCKNHQNGTSTMPFVSYHEMLKYLKYHQKEINYERKPMTESVSSAIPRYRSYVYIILETFARFLKLEQLDSFMKAGEDKNQLRAKIISFRTELSSSKNENSGDLTGQSSSDSKFSHEPKYPAETIEGNSLNNSKQKCLNLEQIKGNHERAAFQRDGSSLRLQQTRSTVSPILQNPLSEMPDPSYRKEIPKIKPTMEHGKCSCRCTHHRTFAERKLEGRSLIFRNYQTSDDSFTERGKRTQKEHFRWVKFARRGNCTGPASDVPYGIITIKGMGKEGHFNLTSILKHLADLYPGGAEFELDTKFIRSVSMVARKGSGDLVEANIHSLGVEIPVDANDQDEYGTDSKVMVRGGDIDSIRVLMSEIPKRKFNIVKMSSERKRKADAESESNHAKEKKMDCSLISIKKNDGTVDEKPNVTDQPVERMSEAGDESNGNSKRGMDEKDQSSDKVDGSIEATGQEHPNEEKTNAEMCERKSRDEACTKSFNNSSSLGVTYAKKSSSEVMNKESSEEKRGQESGEEDQESSDEGREQISDKEKKLQESCGYQESGEKYVVSENKESSKKVLEQESDEEPSEGELSVKVPEDQESDEEKMRRVRKSRGRKLSDEGKNYQDSDDESSPEQESMEERRNQSPCLEEAEIYKRGNSKQVSDEETDDEAFSEEENEQESDENKDQESERVIDRDSDTEEDRESNNESYRGSDNEVDRDSDNEVDRDSDNEVDRDSDNEVDRDSDNEVDRDSDNEVDRDSHNKVDRDSDNEMDRDSENEVDRDSDSEIDHCSDNKVNRDSDNESYRGAHKKVNHDSDNESYRSSDSEVDRDSDNESYRGKKVDRDSDNESYRGKKVDHDSDNESYRGSDKKVDQDSDNESYRGSDKKVDHDSDNESYRGSDSEVDHDSDDESYRGSDNESYCSSEKKVDHFSDTEEDRDSDNESYHGSDSEVDRDSDNESYRDSDNESYRGSDNESYCGSDKKVDHGSDNESYRGSDKKVDHGSDNESYHGSDSEVDRDSDNESYRGSDNDVDNGSDNESYRGSDNVVDRASYKEVDRDSDNEADCDSDSEVDSDEGISRVKATANQLSEEEEAQESDEETSNQEMSKKGNRQKYERYEGTSEEENDQESDERRNEEMSEDENGQEYGERNQESSEDEKGYESDEETDQEKSEEKGHDEETYQKVSEREGEKSDEESAAQTRVPESCIGKAESEELCVAESEERKSHQELKNGLGDESGIFELNAMKNEKSSVRNEIKSGDLTEVETEQKLTREKLIGVNDTSDQMIHKACGVFCTDVSRKDSIDSIGGNLKSVDQLCATTTDTELEKDANAEKFFKKGNDFESTSNEKIHENQSINAKVIDGKLASKQLTDNMINTLIETKFSLITLNNEDFEIKSFVKGNADNEISTNEKFQTISNNEMASLELSEDEVYEVIEEDTINGHTSEFVKGIQTDSNDEIRVGNESEGHANEETRAANAEPENQTSDDGLMSQAADEQDVKENKGSDRETDNESIYLLEESDESAEENDITNEKLCNQEDQTR